MVKKTKKNNNNNNNNKSKKICYTGIGSKKSGIHTEKEFLNILDKNLKKDCSKFIKRKKCPSCIKFDKEIQKYLKKRKKNTNYKWSDKEEKKQDKLLMTCIKCKNRNLKKCDLNNYIEFSGAYIGDCNNNENNNIKKKK